MPGGLCLANLDRNTNGRKQPDRRPEDKPANWKKWEMPLLLVVNRIARGSRNNT
jgi:hypothetical protein